MSSMLEQAIVDASELREAAIKSAEASVVEKYSSEVKQAVAQLLEQDDLPLDATMATEDPAAQGDIETEESTTMEQVPMAHVPGHEEDDYVEVKLDDILDAVRKEEPSVEDSIEAEMDVEEVDPMVTDDTPGNRDDEIDLDEEELVNIFKEMLTVEVPEVELERSAARADEAANHPDEVETDEVADSTRKKEQTIYSDGMDEEDLEEYERTMAKNESLTKENSELVNLLEQAKNKLQELSLQNARLYYANRVFGDPSLNEQQKNKIVELISSARSVTDAKTVFETLQKTMDSTSSRQEPQSLSEAVTRRSSVIISGRTSEQSTERPNEYNRWAKLAGMKKD